MSIISPSLLCPLLAAQFLTWLLLFPSYSTPCGSFFTAIVIEESFATLQFVFSENCSTWRCIFDVFIGEGELNILLLCHLDLFPPSLWILIINCLGKLWGRWSFIQNIPCTASALQHSQRDPPVSCGLPVHITCVQLKSLISRVDARTILGGDVFLNPLENNTGSNWLLDLSKAYWFDL